MARKQKIVHEGKLYYSVPLIAKLLGKSTASIKKIMISEELDWANFSVNGPIYISAESFKEYERRIQVGFRD
jgi:hypothetical protein